MSVYNKEMRMPVKQRTLRQGSGFSLIELLLTIGIISVLATVVFVALAPAKRFVDARDARRNADVQNILSALRQYIVDNKGALPSGINTTERQLGSASSGCAISAGECSVSADACLDVSGDVAKYLKSLPTDPQNGSSSTTHYSVQTDANGIVTVRACDTEGTLFISISR